MNDLINISEEIHSDWLKEKIQVTPDFEGVFDLEYLPEPYLDFSTGTNPIFFLTTNPGKGMVDQHLSHIWGGSSKTGITKEDTYKSSSRKLAEFYLSELSGAAKRRIEGFNELASLAGFDGFIQVESFPYHSKDLPNKGRLLAASRSDKFLSRYIESLTSFLENKNSICLSSIGARRSISLSSVTENVWTNWVAKVLNINLEKANLLSLTEKNGKVTSAFIWENSGSNVRGLILMMGTNNLPGPEQLKKIGKLISHID